MSSQKENINKGMIMNREDKGREEKRKGEEKRGGGEGRGGEGWGGKGREEGRSQREEERKEREDQGWEREGRNLSSGLLQHLTVEGIMEDLQWRKHFHWWRVRSREVWYPRGQEKKWLPESKGWSTMSHPAEDWRKMRSETWPWASTFNTTLKGAFSVDMNLIGSDSKRMEKVQVKIMRRDNCFDEFSVNSVTSSLGVAKRPLNATMDFYGNARPKALHFCGPTLEIFPSANTLLKHFLKNRNSISVR